MVIPEELEESTAAELQGEKGEKEEDVEALKEALAQEREKAERYLANWQRAQADFINYKRRTEQEREEVTKFANATLLHSLLPILDDLERALGDLSTKLEGLAWLEGVRLIYRKLQATLESQGISPIEAVGRDFDPNLHEAFLYGEGEEGKVLEELRKGYRLHDRVFRPTLVKVGRGPQKTEVEEK